MASFILSWISGYLVTKGFITIGSNSGATVGITPIRIVPESLPSKEGLNVSAEISILYHVKQEKAIDIVNEVGRYFERVLILSTFRSASADVCARFFAKDMHSGKRAVIEKEIKDQKRIKENNIL